VIRRLSLAFPRTPGRRTARGLFIRETTCGTSQRWQKRKRKADDRRLHLIGFPVWRDFLLSYYRRPRYCIRSPLLVGTNTVFGLCRPTLWTPLFGAARCLISASPPPTPQMGIAQVCRPPPINEALVFQTCDIWEVAVPPSLLLLYDGCWRSSFLFVSHRCTFPFPGS